MDHRNKSIVLPGRTIHLTDRCYELLQRIHHMDEMPVNTGGVMKMCTWNNGYFKFVVRPDEMVSFEKRELNEVRRYISTQLRVFVCRNLGYDVNYRQLYLLGFYDYIVRNVGDEEAQRLILSKRNKDDVAKIMMFAAYYGLKMNNVSHIKRALAAFVHA